MSLLTKKTGKLTADERKALFRAVGTSALPYPASHFVTGPDGQLQMEIGIIADDSCPLAVYADQSHDHVVGLLYRDMAIPSLLHVQKEAILRRAPDSRNRLMAIMGDPGSGKSHMAKMMARVRDPRGAEVVDCGGRYMGDLLWEQVIDYGEDFKTALTARIRSGNLSVPSAKILENHFADALVKDDEGRITDIQWDKTAEPHEKEGSTKQKPIYESTEEAVERSLKLIRTVAEYEGIPTQTVNTVGVKKQPGAIIRAFKEGRELVLDEYTKSIEGSDDSLQTVLQFLTGEIDEATVENSMKVNGREETYEFTFRREDVKAGFFVTMTGNKDHDGHSTHTLSRSAYSRISPFAIEDPLPVDWKHRVSQIMTGVPLSTLYAVFSDMAQDDPDEFGDMLVELRLMGLSDREKALVPAHQITMLKNWQQTNAAVEKLANFYMYWARIVDPQSDLYDPEKQQNNDNIEQILPEISAGYRDECAIDFRKVIQDVGEALKIKPSVKKIQPGGGLRLNFSAVGRQQTSIPVVRPEVISSEFGSRMEDVLRERIGTITAGRPKLQEALIKEARERGIVALTSSQEALQQQTLSQLLNQDVFEHLGGIKSVVAIRDVLAERMKKDKPEFADKSYAEIVPMDQAAAVCDELSRMSSNDNEDTPRMGRAVLLGDDLDRIFNQVAVIDSVAGPDHKQGKPEAGQLVCTSDFLETLKIPALADINMRSIWRKTMSAESPLPESEDLTPVVQIAEGTHSSKIGITTIMTQSENGAAVPMHVMIDGERRKSLIVTEGADDKTRAALGNGYTVVNYDDPAAEGQVQAFISETLGHGSRKDKAADLEKQVTYAFMLRAGSAQKVQKLSRMLVTKELPTEAPVYMVRQPA